MLFPMEHHKSISIRQTPMSLYFFFKEDVNSSAMMCILLLVMVIANEVSIWNLLCMALSSTRVEALPGLHTLSGADFKVISTVKKKLLGGRP